MDDEIGPDEVWTLCQSLSLPPADFGLDPDPEE